MLPAMGDRDIVTLTILCTTTLRLIQQLLQLRFYLQQLDYIVYLFTNIRRSFSPLLSPPFPFLRPVQRRKPQNKTNTIDHSKQKKTKTLTEDETHKKELNKSQNTFKTIQKQMVQNN